MASNEEKDGFYKQLQGMMEDILGHDMKILLGDFNAQIGSDRTDWEEVMVGRAEGVKSDNGERIELLQQTAIEDRRQLLQA